MTERRQAPTPDPVLSEFELPLEGAFFPLGFPLEIATNSEDVLETAEQCWGQFRKRFSEPPVRLRVGVLDGNAERLPSGRVVRAQRHLMAWMSGASDFSVCDLRQGFGFCWLAPATAANRAHLRYHYLEAMAYTLLQSLYLTPIHAACVALNGRGLLLCGESEAGKSTLAYACAKRGWTFISDDFACVVRSWDRNVVIGNPHLIRLREPAAGLFPELRGRPIILRANGDRAIELATSSLENLVAAPQSPVDYLVFLRRQSAGGPAIEPFPKQRALRWLESVLCFGERDVREAQAASLRRLLDAEVLEFRYSDLESAVAELKSLVNSANAPSRASNLSMECSGDV